MSIVRIDGARYVSAIYQLRLELSAAYVLKDTGRRVRPKAKGAEGSETGGCDNIYILPSLRATYFQIKCLLSLIMRFS